MKVILNYSSYFNHGKQYHIKFIYDNKQEIENINDLMKKLEDPKIFNYYYLDNKKNISLKNTNIFGGTNIPKNILHPFLNILLSIKETTLIIGSQKFTNYEQNKIDKAINKLHINATLNKGKYFNIDSTYYIIFKYASDEQITQIQYAFQTKLNIQAGPNSTRAEKKQEHLIPYLVDHKGDITSKKAYIIGGINIPEDLLKDYIKYFVEEHDIIINIGNIQLKEKFDIEKFNDALTTINQEKIKVKTKEFV